ncbi:MAG: hypothetical protein Q7S39_01725 [Ignavibacteria bacterium]|nr:hypothetical protein [Ignavibacteria bacterium]
MADEWDKWHNKEIPTDLLKDQSFWTFDEKPTATRASSSVVLNRLANLPPD